MKALLDESVGTAITTLTRPGACNNKDDSDLIMVNPDQVEDMKNLERRLCCKKCSNYNKIRVHICQSCKSRRGGNIFYFQRRHVPAHVELPQLAQTTSKPNASVASPPSST